MITRDKDDLRNKEEGEMGRRGVRMVVMADLQNDSALSRFWAEMEAPGSRMYEELSKMRVKGAAERAGALNAVLGPWDITQADSTAPLPSLPIGRRHGGLDCIRVVQADQPGEAEVLRGGRASPGADLRSPAGEGDAPASQGGRRVPNSRGPPTSSLAHLLISHVHSGVSAGEGAA